MAALQQEAKLSKTFGIITVVFVETKLKIGSDEERMNSIAQVIAECDGQTFL